MTRCASIAILCGLIALFGCGSGGPREGSGRSDGDAPGVDTGLADAGSSDAPVGADARSLDASPNDAATSDAPPSDATDLDAQLLDASGPDAFELPDAVITAPDAGSRDTGPCQPPSPAVDVSAQGRFQSPWLDIMNDADGYRLWECVTLISLPRYQAFFTLTLTAPHDVRIQSTTSTMGIVNVALMSSCSTMSAYPLDCIPGATSSRLRNLGPGTYLIVAQNDVFPGGPAPTGNATIDVTLLPPTAPAANVTCAAAVDISDGAPRRGFLSEALVEYEAPLCSSATYATLAYTFTIGSTSDVEIAVTSSSSSPLLIVASDCMALRTTNLSCQPDWASLGGLAPGTYYALVGGTNTIDGSGEFTITAQIRPHAGPIAGDSCSMPDVVSPGIIQGDFYGATNSLAGTPIPGTVCQQVEYDGGPDIFYAFSLPGTRDVQATVTGVASQVALFQSCSDIFGTTIACFGGGFGTRSSIAARNLAAGSYLLRVQAAESATVPPGRYQLALRADIPDSTCLTPFATITGVGSTQLVGTTTTSFDDHHGACGGSPTIGSDVVIRLIVSVRSRVVVDTSGSDPSVVAYLRSGCPDTAVQDLCASPIGAAALDPGTYSIIVDSTRASQGSFVLTVDRIAI
jgi:hypothetical protein